MGTSSVAHCFSCGYGASFLIGGGERNFRTYAAWPVSCNHCAALTTANFKKPLVCEVCHSPDVVPFSDPSLWKGDGKEETERWGDLRLTDGHYRCPKCSKFELRFGRAAGQY